MCCIFSTCWTLTGIFVMYCSSCGNALVFCVIYFLFFSSFPVVLYLPCIIYAHSKHLWITCFSIVWCHVVFSKCGTWSGIVYILLFFLRAEHTLVLWNFELYFSTCVVFVLHVCSWKNKRSKKMLHCLFFMCERALIFHILFFYVWFLLVFLISAHLNLSLIYML